MHYPPKPHPGDRVAVVSPSSGLPGLFPAVYELGLRRLTETFGLVPVEYPTTRRMGASVADRVADLHAAFADPEITAVLATIGGDDQITLLRHLDNDLLRANPKPFFGYSDNTNLLHHLYGLGIVGYHGGSVMVHLGRAGRLHPAHEESLRAALLGDGWHELTQPDEWGDEQGNWSDPGYAVSEPTMWPAVPWQWENADRVVEGRSWGGNVEIVSWLLAAGRVGPSEEFAGGVLFLETSEEMPPAIEVYRMLRNVGERELLRQFPAILWSRPKAWEFDRRHPPEVKQAFIADQYEAVRQVVAEYHPTAMLVLGVDIGHADPQLIVPYGGSIRVDGPARRISVHY
jgi:muramoyltetrapeptide carboxypeptidase LdcA involved in peptidoglycan recycling